MRLGLTSYPSLRWSSCTQFDHAHIELTLPSSQLELLLNLHGFMEQTLHLYVMMQLHFVGDLCFYTKYESHRCRFFILIHTNTNHCQLYLLVVIFHTIVALSQSQQPFVKISTVVGWHKSSPHNNFHLFLCVDSSIFAPLSNHGQLNRTRNSIANKLSNNRFYLFTLEVVVNIKNILHLLLLLQVGFAIVAPID